MDITTWLKDTTTVLRESGISSARLDAEIILAHTLRKQRTWLHAHGDELLEPRQREIADARVDLRRDHTPIAYIIGHKEFYGRTFYVTPSTLIPRPESEMLITVARSLTLPPDPTIIDVGTGSGALGLTLALELPTAKVILTDISEHALSVARRNAKQLAVMNGEFVRSDLLSYWSPFIHAPVADLIVANLPYVDRSWYRNRETDHEPELALFADDHGLHLIHRLIEQAEQALGAGGYLLLEADPRQFASIKKRGELYGFHTVRREGYAILLAK